MPPLDHLPTSVMNDLWPPHMRNQGRQVNKGLRDALTPWGGTPWSPDMQSANLLLSHRALAGKWRAGGLVHGELCDLLGKVRECVRDGKRINLRVHVTIITADQLSMDEEGSPGVLPEHYVGSAALMGVLHKMEWLVGVSAEVCDAWLGRMVNGLQAVVAENGQPGVGAIHKRLQGIFMLLWNAHSDRVDPLKTYQELAWNWGRVCIGHGLFLFSDLCDIDRQRAGSQYVPVMRRSETPSDDHAISVDQHFVSDSVRDDRSDSDSVKVGAEVWIRGSLLSSRTFYFIRCAGPRVLRLHGNPLENTRCKRPAEHPQGSGYLMQPCVVCSLQGTKEVLASIREGGSSWYGMAELDVRDHGYLPIKAVPEMLDAFRLVKRAVIMYRQGVPFTGVCGLVANPRAGPGVLTDLYISVCFGMHVPGLVPSFPSTLKNLAIGHMMGSNARWVQGPAERCMLQNLHDMLGALSGTLQTLVLFGLGTAPEPTERARWGDLGAGRGWSIEENVDHNDVLTAPLQEGKSWQRDNRYGFRITWAA